MSATGDRQEQSPITLEQRRTDAVHAQDNPLQGALWAQYKRRMGQQPLAFRVKSAWGSCDLLLLLTEVGRQRYAGYLPWAPNIAVPEEQQGPFLEALSEALRAHVPAGTVYLRFDLPWESPYGDEVPSQQLRELRMNFSSAHKRLRKAAQDVQPVDTVLVDTDRSEQEILADMHRKTRYNLRLASKHGVDVREADPQAELDEWYALYRDTMERKGLTVHGREHFEALFHAHADTDRSHRLSLLFAHAQGARAAAIITAQTDAYSLYLYGASNPDYRNLMPAYALQWRAIERARARGAARYDLYGIPSDRSEHHPMHGLLRFKEGFGGRLVSRRGCWDYPLRLEEYADIRGHELGARGYYG
jgi:lipid II:glycine glycyltransferase (peptidoglycan interpeptide bridge formation enzyme)